MRIRILLFSSLTFKMPTKNLFKKKVFLHVTFWRYGTFKSFFKGKKVKKMSQKSRNQSFSYYFCLMIEGSGSGVGSGSIPLTNGPGSGSRRPKNTWIRIRNTDFYYLFLKCAAGKKITLSSTHYILSPVYLYDNLQKKLHIQIQVKKRQIKFFGLYMAKR